MTSNVACRLSFIEQRLSHMGSDVGSIWLSMSEHRDVSVLCGWVCVKSQVLLEVGQVFFLVDLLFFSQPDQ